MGDFCWIEGRLARGECVSRGGFFTRPELKKGRRKIVGIGWPVIEDGGSPAGYGSAGGQPERRALAKGADASCRGVALSAPRHPAAPHQGPLAQCGKLRGFGGWPPRVRSGAVARVVPEVAFDSGGIRRFGCPGEAVCRCCSRPCRCGLRPFRRRFLRDGGCGRGWR